MSRRVRGEITYDIQGERVKRLKEEGSERGRGEEREQFQVDKLERRRRREGVSVLTHRQQTGIGWTAFSRLLRAEAAEDRRRVEVQRIIQKAIISISLIGLGFGLGWISNWRNPSLAICQCL